jgi:AcrR family transcriptional regulator
VLADKGYDGLSFDEVAARAGVHKTTLYRRWTTKADLILDALHARSDLVVRLRDTGNLEPDLVAFLRTIVRNVTSRTGRSLVLATLRTGAESAEASSLRRRFWDERFERVQDRLDRARDAGQLKADTDTAVLAEALVSSSGPSSAVSR